MQDKQDERVKLARRMISKYQKVFGSSDGKDVLKDLINANFVLDSTFAQNDPYLTALREGQRNVVLRILTILKINPNKFLEEVAKEASHVEI